MMRVMLKISLLIEMHDQKNLETTLLDNCKGDLGKGISGWLRNIFAMAQPENAMPCFSSDPMPPTESECSVERLTSLCFRPTARRCLGAARMESYCKDCCGSGAWEDQVVYGGL